MTAFNGLGVNLSNLYRLSSAKTRSISPENFTGEKGKGGMATEGTGAVHAKGLGPDGNGQGWKVSPSIRIEPGETRVLADIKGMGAIQQIWLTTANLRWRSLIIRMWWDDQENPSVEAPLGDFFCSGWGQFAQINSLAVCVNPGRAFNCYWEMPFRKAARIEIENTDPDDFGIIYYQINYTLTEVPEDAAYFHAKFRRTNPLPYGTDYTILDGIKGRGHYVGTYMAWGVNNSGWWGEGEIKFFMDGDKRVPHHLRHRHRGLFLRRLQFRRWRGRCHHGQPLPRVLYALCRVTAGAAPRRHLSQPDPLRHVPLAPERPDPLRERPEGHHPGTGLAHREPQHPALPAAAGRHRLGRILVSDAADRAVRGTAGPRLSRGDLKPPN